MGYAEHLKSLLSPLGVYASSGFAAAATNCLGAALDAVNSGIAETEREASLNTATDWGLELFAELLPFVPVSSTIAGRRAAMKALAGMSGSGTTAAEINRALAGCGIPALAEETSSTDTVKISFTGVIGQPANFAELSKRIEQILPCHLTVSYSFYYSTWASVEGGEYTWDSFQAAAPTWNALESRILE